MHKLVAIVVLLPALLIGAIQADAKAHPNIVVILADDKYEAEALSPPRPC